jgi:hypothetical protein
MLVTYSDTRLYILVVERMYKSSMLGSRQCWRRRESHFLLDMDLDIELLPHCVELRAHGKGQRACATL